MEFPTTQWSLLAQATLHGEGTAAEALASFCNRYREPVVQFIRRRGVYGEDAEDVAHDFFLHLMDKSTLRKADAARGRFRWFLLGALGRFLGDEKDRRIARKRGGGAILLPLEAQGPDAELASTPPADDIVFDREWALALLANALRHTEEDCAREESPDVWLVLRQYMPGAVEASSYEESAARLNLTVGAFKSAVHRWRKRFRARLREEVAGTVVIPTEIDAEIAYLARVLRTDSPASPAMLPHG